MTTLLIAFIGGLLPSIVWLAFWLLEDRCQPEPKFRLVLTFLSGIGAVAIALALETGEAGAFAGTSLLFLWAATEEILKLGAAMLFGLASRAYDEPLDAVVYMTTAALGFASAENGLYLFASLSNSAVSQSLLSGDLRFVGATLLHTLASATVGLSMAFFFYSSFGTRILALAAGVILAVGLHTLFNFFILWAGGAHALAVFLPIWLGIVAALALIERVKDPKKDYC